MEYLRHPNIEHQKQKVDELIEKLGLIDIRLQQKTADKEQLNPQERMISIKNVWDVVKTKLNNPETALDVGSGFAYGTVFLDMNDIQAIGVENVYSKNEQALELFHEVGIILNKVNKIDFSKSPAILWSNFIKLRSQEVTDLITMFYVSGELAINPTTFHICKRLLKKEGKIILSTEADKAAVEDIINKGGFVLPDGFSYEIIDVPNNFEKTVIILSKT